MPSDVARTWGSTADERAQTFPCDALLTEPDDVYFRALDVDAPAGVLFRWLCQLRAAPYSYDWLDNLGRRSPRTLTPGLDRLEVGQRVMTIFELAAFETDCHLTIRMRHATTLFGEVAASYLIRPRERRGSRLVVKLLVRHPGGLVRRGLYARLLSWGDLVMMRRQLFTLRELAERSSGTSGTGRAPSGCANPPMRSRG